ncbi:efflux transporter outer membrane subunit [Cecembia sp.]|uniref:efflux transporter outer membrane subunit n=1 Tax=Cecembia sp. TaxID=1898110 RepID=UPI0025C0D02F|nr:efflux transporter outer membrane subunit [Cecembia sp.]
MKKAIGIFSLLVLLAACKAGKPYQGVDLSIPDTEKQAFGQVSEDEIVNTLDLSKSGNANLLWWEYFEDPLLDTLIKTGLQYNRNVLIAAERIVQTRMALRIQNAELLPKFGAQASAERGNFLFNQIGQVNELYIAGTGLNWEIDFWGRLRNLSDAARYQLLSSEFGLQSLQISLIADIATTYFNWLQALEELEIAQSNLALRDSMHQIIVARFDKGIVQQTDVDQSNILKTIAAGTVPKFQRKSIQLENALSFLIGMNPMRFANEAGIEALNMHVDIDQFQPADLLINRPDIIAAEYQLMSQNAQVGAAKARRLPAISLDATLGIISDDLSTLNFSNPLWNIGGQLVGPIFFWGQIRRMIDIEQSKEFQALFAYENTVLNALREVEDVKVEIRTLMQEIDIAKERKGSALSAQFLSGERYSQGVTSYLEVLESQRQAFDAELELVFLQQSLLSAYARFYKVMGGGPVGESGF